MQDGQIDLLLALENVKKSCLQNGGTFRFETHMICGDGTFKWTEITVTLIESNEENAIVRICDIDEAFLMRRIVDLFMYQNYDYLLLIDSKKHSYIPFTGGKGSIPLPPECGEHYTQKSILPLSIQEDTMRMNKGFISRSGLPCTDCRQLNYLAECPS